MAYCVNRAICVSQIKDDGSYFGANRIPRISGPRSLWKDARVSAANCLLYYDIPLRELDRLEEGGPLLSHIILTTQR